MDVPSRGASGALSQPTEAPRREAVQGAEASRCSPLPVGAAHHTEARHRIVRSDQVPVLGVEHQGSVVVAPAGQPVGVPASPEGANGSTRASGGSPLAGAACSGFQAAGQAGRRVCPHSPGESLGGRNGDRGGLLRRARFHPDHLGRQARLQGPLRVVVLPSVPQHNRVADRDAAVPGCHPQKVRARSPMTIDTGTGCLIGGGALLRLLCNGRGIDSQCLPLWCDGPVLVVPEDHAAHHVLDCLEVRGAVQRLQRLGHLAVPHDRLGGAGLVQGTAHDKGRLCYRQGPFVRKRKRRRKGRAGAREKGNQNGGNRSLYVSGAAGRQ